MLSHSMAIWIEVKHHEVGVGLLVNLLLKQLGYFFSVLSEHGTWPYSFYSHFCLSWAILKDAKVQRCKNAEMQRCRDKEMQKYDNT